MKFVMIVLAIHFIGEVISNKRKETRNRKIGERNETIRHPAEYDLR